MKRISPLNDCSFEFTSCPNTFITFTKTGSISTVLESRFVPISEATFIAFMLYSEEPSVQTDTSKALVRSFNLTLNVTPSSIAKPSLIKVVASSPQTVITVKGLVYFAEPTRLPAVSYAAISAPSVGHTSHAESSIKTVILLSVMVSLANKDVLLSTTSIGDNR